MSTKTETATSRHVSANMYEIIHVIIKHISLRVLNCK